jgi:hypothetical protein
MQTIHLIEQGAFLGSRFAGRELREQIEPALATGIALDFAGVQSVTDSFLDEFLGMLIVRRGPGVLRSLVFTGCDRNTEAAIRFALEEAVSGDLRLIFR